jgi:uncharacterized membrane protein YkvA (DUF1232 family)
MDSSNNQRVAVFANLVAWFLQGLYIVSPIDFIPDILPFIGWADDAFLFSLCMVMTVGTVVWIMRANPHLSFLEALAMLLRPRPSSNGEVILAQEVDQWDRDRNLPSRRE